MSDYHDLPDPEDSDLAAEFGAEERAVYGYLLERVEDPPTMVEVETHIQRVTGTKRAQTGRRLRELRRWFDILVVRRKGGSPVYQLAGLRPPQERKPKREALSSRLEAEVYASHNNRCAMCGKSPSEDGVHLVIDHKIPVEWGGETVFENLQPLCEYHNHGKQAWVASLDPHADAIRASISLGEPQLRIGELLKALAGEPVPADVIAVVAREENSGDPLRRLRDLRTLGWDVRASRKKEGKRTRSYYTLVSAMPWPPGGPQAAVAEIESRRKRKRPHDQ